MGLIFQRGTSTKYGTQGKWFKDGLEYCKTLEPENPGLPAGVYLLQLYWSPSHKFYVPRYISLIDPTIAPRCIEVHPGNIYVDTTNCTLPGTGYDDFDCAATWPNDPIKNRLGIVPGIIESKKTFGRIMEEIYLGKIIKNPDNTEDYIGGTEIEVRN